jgi:hypothetical protein
MTLFFKKLREKILRLFLTSNFYEILEQINEIGPNFLGYFEAKCSAEERYPNILCEWYRKNVGKKLDLDNPLTFNEKIQWLKLYDTSPLKSCLSDKYMSRQWIAERIGEKYLVPLLGVWNNFDEIDFNILPRQFVLKATHGCGWNIVVKDKSKLNKLKAKRKFDLWLNMNFTYINGLELQYRDIEPKIIAEQYIEDNTGELPDYKFLCFNGEPKYLWVWIDSRDGTKNIYDLDWKLQPFTIEYPNGKRFEKPNNFDEMIHIAEILSDGFPHVRVDLHNANSKIYFGEMTFTSYSGIVKIQPEEWDRRLGDMIKLPNIQIK